MEKYNPQKIELKWQKEWEKQGIYKAENFSKKPKKYILFEFPYPSGDGLHVGHCRSSCALDAVVRKKRMEGYNVLFPIGWDAFGLPAENYAIKTGVHPKKTTAKNIANFKRQYKMLGISLDWDREINTTDPEYYKWTQWIFLKLFEKGLAYQAEMPINWCPSCKIGLANEEVVSGKCERCGAAAEKKQLKQWMLKITEYADRLIEDLKKVDYPEKVKAQQINWIGRSEGAEIDFSIVIASVSPLSLRALRYRSAQAPRSNLTKDEIASSASPPRNDRIVKVFTTRADTLFGCTYLVVAPEHPLVASLLKLQNTNYKFQTKHKTQITKKIKIQNLEEVKRYVEKSKHKSDLERTELIKEKTGVEIKGIKAINPVNQEEIPIFVADYVLPHYGTGAIMAVPAHDQRDYDFAKKYGLETREVISGGDISKEAFVDYGILINSGKFNGLSSKEAIKKITKWLEKNELGKKAVNYKLRDWVFSRQHYWGEPIPLIFCENCKKLAENYKAQITNYKQNTKHKIQKAKFNQGELLNSGWVAVQEKDLPVELPYIEKYQPSGTGESPLVKVSKWVNVKCPKCGLRAKRETDTMPNWAGSSWYFIRYTDPQNNKVLADKKKLKYWMPVDWYNGGMEHTTLHLLYSRFWYKFLFDIGVVPQDEPYQKRTSHGMVLAEDGRKMSKSLGNVINPDDIVKKYGADTLRLYEMFMGPYGQAIAWNTKGVVGMRRFLEKIWRFSQKFQIPNYKSQTKHKTQITKHKLERLVHQTIKKVTEDIENLKFNTAISQLMILVNEMERQNHLSLINYKLLLKLLSPFAPHISEELWQKLGHKKSIFQEKWPKYDPKLVKEEKITLVIQINGKVRDKIEVEAGILEDEAKKLALSQQKVLKYIKGKTVKKVIFVNGKLINIVV